MFRLVRLVRSIVREKLKDRQRSPHWPSTRDAFLKLNAHCVCCGGTKRLQVHHVQPFHLHPDLELDPSNLITLCMFKSECHLFIGHGDDWRSWNPDVRKDAAEFLSSPPSRKRLVTEAERKAEAMAKHTR